MAEFDAYWKSKYDESDTDQNGKLSQKELHADPSVRILGSGRERVIHIFSGGIPQSTHKAPFQQELIQQQTDGLLTKGEIWN